VSDIDDRIKELFTLFKLPTMAAECVRRFRNAHHDDALDVLLETLEAELGERRVRRCERLLRAARLPPGKTIDTLDPQRLSKGMLPRLRELSTGDFLERTCVFRCTRAVVPAGPERRFRHPSMLGAKRRSCSGVGV